MTFILSASATLMAIVIGPSIGILLSKHMKVPYISRFLAFFVWITGATPFYLQLFGLYFVLPQLIAMRLEPVTAGIIALAACSSAQVAEIVRGCSNVIPQSQFDVSNVLGYSKYAVFRYIIFPQAMIRSLPYLSNILIQNVHATTVISMIGVVEITSVANNIISRDMCPMIILLISTCFYLLFSVMAVALVRRLERIYHYDLLQ